MINLRTFDLNLLRIFEAIYRDRSVSIAAGKLGLSQPAVSSALNRLRRLFDDPLFVRSARGMEPTPKAELLAEAVGVGLNILRAGISTTTSFDPANSTRKFHIVMTDVGELLFLPTLLQMLSEVAPHIDVSVVEAGVPNYEDLLDTGRADLAIGRFQLPASYSSKHIHTSAFVVVLRQDHPFVETRRNGALYISYENYLRASHISVEPPGASADPIERALAADRGKRRIALTIPHSTVLGAMIGGTQLVATVPDKCVEWLLHGNPSLCAIPVPFPVDKNLVYQWWHKRNDKDPGHSWLREHIERIGG